MIETNCEDKKGIHQVLHVKVISIHPVCLIEIDINKWLSFCKRRLRQISNLKTVAKGHLDFVYTTKNPQNTRAPV